MAAAGATIHRETVGNAAMGWRGALRVFEVLRLLRWTRTYFQMHKPDLQICVDSPAMNFHFAKVARSLGVPVLYYVAPQLWGWREGRMRKLRANVDQLACILPFEQEYFRGHGVNTTFVGHPLFDQLPRLQSPVHANDSIESPVIGLLPGSRTSEAEHNFPPMLEVAALIAGEFPAARFLVPSTPATHPVVKCLLEDPRHADIARQIQCDINAFDTLVPQCDLCITVSGTATLHVAGFGVPMIVVYRASPLLWHGVGRWLMKTRTFALVNLLAVGQTPSRWRGKETHIVPEFIPWYGPAAPLARHAIALLRDPRKLAEQRSRLTSLVHSLDQPGASERVAGIALHMMEAGSSRLPTSAPTSVPTSS